jgi:tetratricopeptide (TPR) repeat protein
MSLFKKLFGKSEQKNTPVESAAKPPVDPAKDPNLIRVFDKYGQEMFITREVWRDSILMGNIDKAWKNPDELYGIIVQSLHDEFVKEIVPAAEQLHKIDPVPSRGATILGIAYMETGRLDEAEQVLSDYLAKHGDEGVVLNNLAKVYSKRGLEEKSEKTLWHALEVDPNQDNGMGWYEVIRRERDGEKGGLDALRRVAAISGSWRAQLWLARAELEDGNLNAALDFYKESLANAGEPTPGDLLQQMSGDLGNKGHLHQIIEWVGPHFDVKLHGIMVGNNLIKAHLDTGNLDAARFILDQLYALKRPDWKDTLSFWDTELAKARIAIGEPPTDGPMGVTMLSIEGPIWMRGGSPFSKLLSKKASDGPVIGILGSTASYSNPSDQCVTQLANGPGRLSRALPLIMTEQLHLKTDAVAHAIIPHAQGHGFVLMGKPYSDEALLEAAAKQNVPMNYIVYVTLDTVSEPWKLNARLLRISDGELLGAASGFADPGYPGDGVKQLLADVHKLVAKWTNVRAGKCPEWYQLPNEGPEYSDYLLRLEQQLAVVCMNLDFLQGCGLSGEREILSGTLQYCVRNPNNQTARMLFIQTLRQMKKARPDILPEFKDKVNALQNEFPVSGQIGELAAEAIAEVFS